MKVLSEPVTVNVEKPPVKPLQICEKAEGLKKHEPGDLPDMDNGGVPG